MILRLRTVTMMLALGLSLVLGGCVLPPQPGDDDDDDDASGDDDDTGGDDDTGDDDTGDDDTGDDDTGDDDTGDDDTGDDDTGDDDTGDDDTGDDDTGDDDTGDDDSTPTDDSIHDVRQGVFAEDTVVSLEQVIVTTPVSLSPPGFWIQEPAAAGPAPYSGIYVYVPDPAEMATVAATVVVGDAIDITARYQEYYDLSELVLEQAADLAVVGSGNISPTNVSPCEVATGGAQQEAFESVLVRVIGVQVTDTNPDDPLDYGEFEVGGCLRVDDFFILVDPTPGQSYTAIVGPMNYAYSQAKLEPRSQADLSP